MSQETQETHEPSKKDPLENLRKAFTTDKDVKKNCKESIEKDKANNGSENQTNIEQQNEEFEKKKNQLKDKTLQNQSSSSTKTKKALKQKTSKDTKPNNKVEKQQIKRSEGAKNKLSANDKKQNQSNENQGFSSGIENYRIPKKEEFQCNVEKNELKGNDMLVCEENNNNMVLLKEATLPGLASTKNQIHWKKKFLMKTYYE